jgi:hypothetical protein
MYLNILAVPLLIVVAALVEGARRKNRRRSA